MRKNIIAMFGSRKVLRKKNVKKNNFFIFSFTIIFFKLNIIRNLYILKLFNIYIIKEIKRNEFE